MSVDESWQSRISTAGNLNFTLKVKVKVDVCFNYVFTSISYIILLEEHSSTAKQDPVTANFHELSSSFDPAFRGDFNKREKKRDSEKQPLSEG